MGKLYEVIAVEKDVKGTAAKIMAETLDTFSKKHHLLGTHSKIWEPLQESDTGNPEEEPAQPITTIGEKLSYVEKHISRLFDVILQKETANAYAKGDVVAHKDGEEITLAKDVPVAALVQLENQLETVRMNVYNSIPTLDPSKQWDKDEVAGIGKYKTAATMRQSTKKINKPLVLHPGNEKHPPQVQLVSEDVVVGNWKITYFSGMISPADKSAILERLDMVIEAVKKARSRANSVDVPNVHIGKQIFKFVNEGKI